MAKKINNFTSSDPHHDISKQLVDTTFGRWGIKNSRHIWRQQQSFQEDEARMYADPEDPAYYGLGTRMAPQPEDPLMMLVFVQANIYGDFMGFHGDFMVISWDFMGFHDDFMGFHDDFMGFHDDFMGFLATKVGEENLGIQTRG